MVAFPHDGKIHTHIRIRVEDVIAENVVSDPFHVIRQSDKHRWWETLPEVIDGEIKPFLIDVRAVVHKTEMSV